MPSRLQSLQKRRAGLNHKYEAHRAKAIALFELAAEELRLAHAIDRDMAVIDREINSITDGTLDRMVTYARDELAGRNEDTVHVR